MKTKKCFFKSCITCVPFLLLFLAPHLSAAATFCVSNETELQTALTAAASNGEDDTVQIVQGTYNGNFTYASTETNSLTIEGGYTEDCSSRTIDPENTVLDGGGVDNVLMLVTDDLAADFSVEGLTIQNGSSLTVSNGGGLYVNTAAELTLSKSIFSGNIATDNGGGACVLGSTDATITDNIFIGNSAGNNQERYCSGGGLFIGQGSVTLTNNKFEKNTVIAEYPKGGGAYLYGTDSNAVIDNNFFLENTAGKAAGRSGHGGGAYINYSQVVITDNTFTENMVLDNNNSQGGGLCLFSNNTSVIENTFNKNTVGNGKGGGAHIRGDILVTISKNKFANNTGTSAGASIVSASGTLKIENNMFFSNEGSGDDYGGGGAYFNKTGSGDFSLTNNIFMDNKSKVGGGGVHLSLSTENSYNYSVQNNVFANNTATSGDGGGLLLRLLFSDGGTVEFLNNEFSKNNSASGKGGGLCIIGDKSNLYLVNCILTKNTAKTEGGGYLGNT